LKIKFLAAVLFPVLLTGTVMANSPDTLTIAKKLRENGKIKESLAILGHYHKNHPKELYANWIYAQVAYQSHKLSLASGLYEQAVRLSPDDNVLRLDYAKFLVNTGNFRKADVQLTKYTAINISNPEPWYYLAKINYWKGKNKESLALLDNLLRNVPGYTPAQLLRDQILRELSPWLSMDASYSSDDQPMNMLNPAIRGGLYRSNLVGLDFRIVAPVSFRSGKNFYAAGFSIGNRFHLSKPNMNFYLNLGVYDLNTLHTIGWTGDFKIEKNLLRKVTVWAEILRKPYLSTESSLGTPVFENHLTLAASLNNPDHWNGRLSFEGSTFSTDNNSIKAFCGWIFVPAIKTRRFDFHFGYGYNYSTAKESRFTSEKPLSEILSAWDPAVPISGIYNPYFTPKDQQVHSLLAIIQIRAAERLKFTVNINGGFYATTQYPYLFLEKDASGSIFIQRASEKKSFNPVSVNAGMDWQVSGSIDLHAQADCSKTIYYTTQTFSISLRKRF